MIRKFSGNHVSQTIQMFLLGTISRNHGNYLLPAGAVQQGLVYLYSWDLVAQSDPVHDGSNSGESSTGPVRSSTKGPTGKEGYKWWVLCCRRPWHSHFDPTAGFALFVLATFAYFQVPRTQLYKYVFHVQEYTCNHIATV